MAAVWVRARAELRARWRAWVGLSLALGVAAGAVLALAAGAQRTASAYPRLVAAERPPEVNSMALEGVGKREVSIDPAAVARLPQVAGVTRVRGFIVLDGRTAAGVAIRNPRLRPGRHRPGPGRAGLAGPDQAALGPHGRPGPGRRGRGRLHHGRALRSRRRRHRGAALRPARRGQDLLLGPDS